VVVTRDGGHCGFVAEAPDGYDGYWAEQTAVTFISRYMSVPPT
jgi:predicted alpha/beta-fold hydrolase